MQGIKIDFNGNAYLVQEIGVAGMRAWRWDRARLAWEEVFKPALLLNIRRILKGGNV